jgi:D-lactate dehydrogenase
MTRIAFFETEDWEAEYLKRKLEAQGFQTEFHREHLTAENASEAADCDALGVFVYSNVDEELLGRLQKLKLVATMSTGYDHIDLEACKRRGIAVCNVPGYGSNTVAEHTFALLLALSRKIVQSVERTRRGDFSLEGLRGVTLRGKTIGVVSTGRIGRNVIRIAGGFGMRVIAYDPRPDAEYARQNGFEYVDFPRLLQESDVVTLHAPLTKETHHLINKENIRQMKRGAVLVNTARGGLVETEALLQGLREGTIAGAGLDVLEEECAIKEERELFSKAFAKTCDLKTVLADHMLLEQENVLITPHNAFNSREALGGLLEETAENISAFFAGSPRNRVA